MKLSKSDFLVISNILNVNLSTYDKRFKKIENILTKMSKENKYKPMNITYDELARSISQLPLEELEGDFTIAKI